MIGFLKEKIKSRLSFDFLVLIPLLFYGLAAGFNFGKTGLLNFDEAYFANVSRTYSEIIKAVLPGGAGLNGGFLAGLMDSYGNIYTAARPAYIVFSSFFDIFTSSPSALLLASFFSGAAAVIFFYFLSAFFSIKRGARLAATVLFSLSPFFLFYSRLGLSQILSCALFLSSLFWLFKFKGERRVIWSVLAGLSLSFLFLSHYNTMFAVFWLILLGLFLAFRSGNRKRLLLSFATAFLLPILFWQGVTMSGVFMAKRLGGGIEISSYFGEIFKQFEFVTGSTDGFKGDYAYYLKTTLQSEGAVLAFFFALGFVLFVLRKGAADIFDKAIIIWLFLFCLILFSISPLKYPRNFLVIFPILYIFALAFFDWIFYWTKNKVFHAAILSIVVCAVLFFNLPSLSNLWNLNSSAPIIAEWIEASYKPQEVVILSWSASVWRDYLPSYRSEVPSRQEDWLPLARDGRKVIFINDYFNIALNQEGYYGLESCDLPKAVFPISVYNNLLFDDIIYDFNNKIRPEFFASANQTKVCEYDAAAVMDKFTK
jgi:4-amino-4-deoxy-L-arabinose transferase-like glycosyltransferase